ncbi:MAG: HD-GYP domain-containing protein [Eubacteriales bacterium]|nr:HD-GYP domain-containing protein [Eubacteriales bacterium]
MKSVKYTKQQITDFENRIFGHRCFILMWAFTVLNATNLFWLVTDIITGSILLMHSTLSYVTVIFAVTATILMACYSGITITKKQFGKLRIPILFLDTVIAIEVTLLCISQNLIMPIGHGSGMHANIPLSSLYLFIFAFLPLVRTGDTIYVFTLAALSVTLPILAPGGANYNPVSSIIMVSCVILAYVALKILSMSHERLVISLEEKQDEYLNLTNESLETVAATIEAKNTYLTGHSKRVAIYSRQIAEKMGFTEEDCNKIYFAGLLHDIGKIGIPTRILDKNTVLTDEEFERVKSHTVQGCDILKNMKEIPELSLAARWHHERFDGSGYPDGLKGENIPVFSRIISVSDAYDAMSSERSYRQALERDAIISELIRCRGTQFDPEIVDVFLSILESPDFKKPEL